MSHVHGVIGRILSKGLMQFEFAHELLWEYIQQATPVQMQVQYTTHCAQRSCSQMDPSYLNAFHGEKKIHPLSYDYH